MSDSNPYRYQEPTGPGGDPYSEGKRKGPGCLFWGCLGVVGLFFLSVIGIGGGTYYWAKSMVATWTDDQPIELPQIAYADEEVKALKDRLDAFMKAHERGEATEDIVLTADDINALVSDANLFKDVETPFYIEIDGDQVRGEMSVPLEEVIPWGMFKGRYLNGSATATAELIGGDLVIRLQSIEVNGQIPPKNIMDGITNEDLFDDNQQDPDFRRFIAKFETLEVRDGRIILKLKANQAAGDADESGAEPEPAESAEPEAPEPDPAEALLEEAI